MEDGTQKPPRIGLDRPATLTTLQNNDMKKRNKTLDGIKNYLDMAKLPPEIRRGFDVHEKFEELDRKLRTTQVDLNMIVSGGKEMTVMQPELPSSVFIRSMNSVTVKIETSGHRGPLQLSVKFDAKEKSDIKVSVHTHAKVNFDEFMW